MIERLTEIGIYYGMEVNMEKAKAMRILRQPSPIQIMTDHKRGLQMDKYIVGLMVVCF